MTTLSLKQAADEIGVSKSTVLRAIQSGRMSARRTDDGRYSIDPAELFRVYGERVAQRDSESEMTQDATPGDVAELHSRIDELQVEVDRLGERIEKLQSRFDLLQQVQVQTAQSAGFAQRRGLLGWLFDRS